VPSVGFLSVPGPLFNRKTGVPLGQSDIYIKGKLSDYLMIFVGKSVSSNLGNGRINFFTYVMYAKMWSMSEHLRVKHFSRLKPENPPTRDAGLLGPEK